MRKTAIFFSMFAFLLPFLFSSESGDYYSYSYARLSYVKGDVFVQRSADLGYEEGAVNLPVVEGDKLGTREGRAEIHFGKKNYLRVDNYTQVDFATLPRRGYDQIKLHVLSGNIYLRINFLEREKDFEIHTPDGSFYILDVGLYRLNVRENQETELLVYSGAVEAAGEEGSLLVEEDQRLIVANGNFRSSPTIFYAELDDSFYQWSEYRESLINRRVAKRYLPTELYEYEEELAFHGRWVYEWPYGHVWVPRVYHNAWRPYYYGRWVWYPFIGWNWVSYDPWGWCVYHYGRWHWRTGLGWYWIPTRIWGPSWVHWHWGYDYIGWCPLNYYGRPLVVINNIFYERYYNSYYPHNSRALTVIHKNHLRARDVSGYALNQTQIERLGKISLSATQPRLRPAIKQISQNTVAARALSRTNLREVGKVYASEKGRSSPSRMKSSLSWSSLKPSQKQLSSIRGQPASKTAMKNTTPRTISRSPTKYKSSSSLGTSKALQRSPSSSSIKTYPSRKASSIKQSSSLSKRPATRTSSSISRVKSDGFQSFPKRNTASESSRSLSSKDQKVRSPVKSYKSTRSYSESSSSKTYVDRNRSSKVQSYTKSRSTSRYSSSKIKSPLRSYSSSSRSYKSPTQSYTKSRSYSSMRSPSRSYSSSSRSYKSSSRSYSRSSSSSKSYSSRSSRSSSRSVSKSHSSSGRSTSSSSSGSKSRKK
jgi:hypothetical protein